MKIAIFGGSFNPIHIGHLFLAEEVRVNCGYDLILFIPAYISPFKTGEPGGSIFAMPSVNDRLAMIELAIAGNEQFRLERCETDRGGISYTYDTLQYILRLFGEQLDEPPGLIIGVGGCVAEQEGPALLEHGGVETDDVAHFIIQHRRDDRVEEARRVRQPHAAFPALGLHQVRAREIGRIEKGFREKVRPLPQAERQFDKADDAAEAGVIALHQFDVGLIEEGIRRRVPPIIIVGERGKRSGNVRIDRLPDGMQSAGIVAVEVDVCAPAIAHARVKRKPHGGNAEITRLHAEIIVARRRAGIETRNLAFAFRESVVDPPMVTEALRFTDSTRWGTGGASTPFSISLIARSSSAFISS